MNEKGVKKCGHCGKLGHTEADCWILYPEKKSEFVKKGGKPGTNVHAGVTCFNCGEKGHYADKCPNKKTASDENTESGINSLFIGSIGLLSKNAVIDWEGCNCA